MSTRNLANIEGGKPPSATVGRRLNELKRIVNALAEVIQKGRHRALARPTKRRLRRPKAHRGHRAR